MLRHGGVIRPTVFLASRDFKTAFDEARPRHVAQIMEGHNTHGGSLQTSYARCPVWKDKRCSNA